MYLSRLVTVHADQPNKPGCVCSVGRSDRAYLVMWVNKLFNRMNSLPSAHSQASRTHRQTDQIGQIGQIGQIVFANHASFSATLTRHTANQQPNHQCAWCNLVHQLVAKANGGCVWFLCSDICCLPVYLFTCLPVYLFTCLPVYLFTCLPVYLFTVRTRCTSNTVCARKH
jgi:hypothetical protein